MTADDPSYCMLTLAKFGVTWPQALADGAVYNAVDACDVLGVDADTLDKPWRAPTAYLGC